MPVDFSDFEDQEIEADGEASGGRRLSREEIARLGSDLFRRTVSTGLDIFREASKELPKEATQFISSRKEQVLRSMTQDVAQVMISSAFENFFRLVRQHKLEISFKIVQLEQESSEDQNRRKPRKSAPQPNASSAKSGGAKGESRQKVRTSTRARSQAQNQR